MATTAYVLYYLNTHYFIYTVKPPKRGHFGVGPFVLCREVVLSQRLSSLRGLGLNDTENFILIENRAHISIP